MIDGLRYRLSSILLNARLCALGAPSHAIGTAYDFRWKFVMPAPSSSWPLAQVEQLGMLGSAGPSRKVFNRPYGYTQSQRGKPCSQISSHSQIICRRASVLLLSALCNNSLLFSGSVVDRSHRAVAGLSRCRGSARKVFCFRGGSSRTVSTHQGVCCGTSEQVGSVSREQTVHIDGV